MWRVMIADDEPYIREGLEKLIPWEELGCELIYVAENGQDLLEQIRSCPPDIAIIDIKMPLMDGMEVAEYIYKNHIRTSVIFLTAYADFQYARKATTLDLNALAEGSDEENKTFLQRHVLDRRAECVIATIDST